MTDVERVFDFKVKTGSRNDSINCNHNWICKI